MAYRREIGICFGQVDQTFLKCRIATLVINSEVSFIEEEFLMVATLLVYDRRLIWRPRIGFKHFTSLNIIRIRSGRSPSNFIVQYTSEILTRIYVPSLFHLPFF